MTEDIEGAIKNRNQSVDHFVTVIPRRAAYS